MNSKTKKEVQIINPTKGIYSDRLKRVAAYCRVSTDSADQINSFLAQVKYYNDFIKQSGDMTLVDIYADEGITGICVKKRDEFQRMMKDSKAGKIDRIYVKSVSRFARNSLECIESIRLLKSYGTTVLFENDGIDTSTMNSEMILYIKSAFAQSESLANSKRVTTAVRMKMQNGEFSICKVPYGFTVENNTLVPVPELKSVIERIYRDYLSGKGYGKIAEELNNEKCTERIWNAAAIKYILHNEKYVGDSLLQKYYTPHVLPFSKKRNYGEVDMYYVQNTHEAIISHDLYDMVKRKTENRNIHKSVCLDNEASVFSHRIRCDDCGNAYKKRILTNETYWVCSLNGISGRKCKTCNIKETELKKAFIRLLNRIKMYENEIVDFSINQLSTLNNRISRQSGEVNEIDMEIASLCNRNSMLEKLKIKDIIDTISYSEQTAEIKKRLSELRSRKIKILNSDEYEGDIEKFRKLKRIISSNKDYFLFFDNKIFNETVEEVTVLEFGYVCFTLKCGLRLKEKI